MPLTEKQIEDILEIRNRLELDLQRQIQISDLVKEFDISESTLSRRFRSLFGMRITEYRLQKVMERGRELLKSGLQVKEVAIILKYSSTQAFSKAFKANFGRAPVKDKPY